VFARSGETKKTRKKNQKSKKPNMKKHRKDAFFWVKTN